jgi:enediyne biosynthesis protein E4
VVSRRFFLVFLLTAPASAALSARAADVPPAALEGVQVPKTYEYLGRKLRQNDTACNTKCWATFRRIEDVVAGRPLREDAAHRRIAIVGEFARDLWLLSQMSEGPEAASVSSATVAAAYDSLLYKDPVPEAPAPDVHGPADTVAPLDLVDYARTSEAWRALITVAQAEGSRLTREVAPAAADLMAESVNHFSVALLKKAARLSYQAGSHDVTPASLDEARDQLLEKTNFAIGRKDSFERALVLTVWYAEGKIESLKSVNGAVGADDHRRTLEEIARLPLEAASVRLLDGEIAPAIARKVWLAAQKSSRYFIAGDRMAEAIFSLYPHRLDEEENIVFFPSRRDSYFVFAHEADSVRDDTMHWKIVADLAAGGSREARSADEISQGLDPYAAEELTEVVSDLVALLAKEAGGKARARGASSVAPEDLREAFAELEDASRTVTPQEASLVWRAPAPAGGAVSAGTAAAPGGRGPEQAEKRPVFVDVTEASGFRTPVRAGNSQRETMTRKLYRSVAVEDFDRDGLPDVWLDGLHRNLGAFHFENVTAAAGLPVEQRFAAFGDFDNDGWPDLCLLDPGAKLYRNRGDGSFEDVSSGSGLFVTATGAKPLWLDYDLDGDLDVHVVYFGGVEGPRLGDSQTAGEKQLFRNNGDGTFTEIGRDAGVVDRRETHAAAVVDYDLDGDPDLFYANDYGQDVLLRNLGNGRFEDVSAAAGVADFAQGMGVSVADFDKDGWPDMYVTNIGVHSPRVRYIRPNPKTLVQSSEYLDQFVRLREANRLYRNNRDGTFTDVVKDVMEPVKTGWGWNGFFFDYDNDGYLDIHVQNGFGTLLYDREPDVLIRFDPKAGKFRDVSAGSGVDVPRMERAGAYADFDRDGYLDLIVAHGGGARLLKNVLGGEKGANRWLTIKLEGTRSNREGFGARVRVVSGRHAQTDWLGGQGGALASHCARELHFGLGSRGKADRVEVVWPSGASQTLRNVKAGQRLVVREPDAP